MAPLQTRDLPHQNIWIRHSSSMGNNTTRFSAPADSLPYTSIESTRPHPSLTHTRTPSILAPGPISTLLQLTSRNRIYLQTHLLCTTKFSAIAVNFRMFLVVERVTSSSPYNQVIYRLEQRVTAAGPFKNRSFGVPSACRPDRR